MNARWLSLPLSARGLLRELANVVDEDDALETSLAVAADARAIGDEIARLLRAFRTEYVRVRRDVCVLVERGFLVLDGSRLRVVDDAANDVAPVTPAPLVGSAKRMRDLRARRRAATNAAPSHVTLRVTQVTRHPLSLLRLTRLI